MLKELDNYDWAEVFGEGTGGNCSPIIPNRAPQDTATPGTTFAREDVETISQMEEGERDELGWVVYGQLKDGRWFVARGSCDYTGWDCRAGNSGDVAGTKDELVRFSLTQDERERFGLKLTPEGRAHMAMLELEDLP